MKKWGIGINTYYKKASLHIDILPWYLYYLERVDEWLCSHFPDIPFPSWLHYTYTDEDGSTEVYTWKDWWGGTRSWFHCYVHMPIFDFVYNQKRCKGYSFDINYESYKKYIKERDKKQYEFLINSEKEDEEDKKETEEK